MQSTSFGLRYHTLRQAAAAFATLVALAGCGEESSAPMTVPVTGEVLLDGNPIPKADVAFTPDAASPDATSAQAVTDATGHFEVVSLFNGGRTHKSGLQPGKYAVAVTQLEPPPSDATLSRAPRNLLPEKYAAAATSGLAVEVNSEGDNHFVLKLFK